MFAADNDVAAAVFAGLGVIFGVMLGQLVVAGWGDYQAARMASFREAAALRNIVRLAHKFGSAQRQTILRAVDNYVRAVLDDEWAMRPNGQMPGHRAEQAIHDLFHLYAEVDMGSERDSPYLQASVSKLEDLSDARAERLASHRSGLPAFMWSVLVVEAAIVIGFVLVLEVEGMLTHAMLTFVLTLAVILLLGLVWVLDNPFRWPARISPSDFVDVLRLVQHEMELEDQSRSG
jgi:hypothetical protein